MAYKLDIFLGDVASRGGLLSCTTTLAELPVKCAFDPMSKVECLRHHLAMSDAKQISDTIEQVGGNLEAFQDYVMADIDAQRLPLEIRNTEEMQPGSLV